LRGLAEFADMMPIESDGHVQRARRTAAWARVTIGLSGIALLIAKPSLLEHPSFGLAGFATIVLTAAVHLYGRRPSWLKVEESLAGLAAILIVGLEGQHVTVLDLLWLAAVASGVMARGGRVHWIGRAVVLTALALPVVAEGRLSAEHAGLIVAATALLLTIGRLTMELNKLLWQARWDADHDDLTGLLSRTAFRAELERISARAQAATPHSLLLFDLDGFGAINKTSGHAAGDALLVSFGEQLARAAAGGGLAGRLGGDEFAFLAPSIDAFELAQRLLATMPRGGDQARRLSASVGIAQTPRDGADAEALLRAADIALRVAKQATGEGQVSAYTGGSLSGHGKLSARGALRRAIAGEELKMVVQPIVDLRTGAVHAYEALARFGADGCGSPLQWFSLADELGEREALERACLREALELFCRRPPRTSLSVNMAAPALLDQRTLRMLDHMPDLTGLIIEVTEEALARSEAQLTETMAPLYARGARLAVDDIGAGYSGLSQIATVRPSYLKLDRSLVKGIDADDGRAALVSALASYAQRSGMLLVAEGMECAAELRTLNELGVPLGQGFFLSRPAAPWPTVPAGLLAPFAASLARGARAGSDSPQRADRSPSSARAQRQRV
jgi:diguanylate cyclase (GGDEF)-like protein